MRVFFRCLLVLYLTVSGRAVAAGDEPAIEDVQAALRRAVRFFHDQVATHGGYVYRYSADLAKREGEGKTDLDTVWVQPPGTPYVGIAYLDAYELTGIDELLSAARDAGRCLLAGQLRSGGWSSEIRFAPADRVRMAYRSEPPREGARNWTTFDDDKSQSAMRFLMQLDQTLNFQDPQVHEAIDFALRATLTAQFPNGAWPQGFQTPPDPATHPVLSARYPETWSRIYPGRDYWQFYTFNDNAIVDVIDTLKMAARVYGNRAYEQAARRGMEFILLSQLPEPQPAWAQQYDLQMQPTWARKFEPPAVSGGESQAIVGALLGYYEETQDVRFLNAAGRALDYLERYALPDGRMARFYELQTNRPLYFTRDYRLTYSPADVPTHYAFIIRNRTPQLRTRFDRLRSMSTEDLRVRLARRLQTSPRELTSERVQRIREILDAQDERGAWVQAGRLQYHGDDDQTRWVIESSTFATNLGLLAEYLAAVAARGA